MQQLATAAVVQGTSTEMVSCGVQYRLEGGVTICDKTCGIASVIFLPQLTEQQGVNVYQPFINGRKLVFPTCSEPSAIEVKVVFVGSVKIVLEIKKKLVKITECDSNSETTIYVDPTKSIEEIAYDAYSYIPAKLSLKEAQEKIKTFKRDFPNIEAIICAYNHHGVALFGCQKITKEYEFYWGSPSQQEVKKISCSLIKVSPINKSIRAKSDKGEIDFHYKPGDGCYLNSELANRIVLPT